MDEHDFNLTDDGFDLVEVEVYIDGSGVKLHQRKYGNDATELLISAVQAKQLLEGLRIVEKVQVRCA